MKIVIAPDSFKESLSASEAAEAIEAGFLEIFPQADYLRIPLADGGEGTVRTMVAATGGRSLSRYADLVRRDLGADVASVPGAGAAGGMGAALLAIGGRLRPGVEIVMESVGLDAALRDADLVITGEGRLDGQTVHGKVAVGVARLAKRYNRPVIALAGSLGDGAEEVLSHGIDARFSVIPRPCSLEEALANGGENLQRTARSVAATIRLSRG